MAVPKPSSIMFALGGRLARADIPQLCKGLRGALEAGDAELVVCDVGALVHPDAVAVDALARLALTARRLGCRIQLRHASTELLELIDLMGVRAPMSSGSTCGLTG